LAVAKENFGLRVEAERAEFVSLRHGEAPSCETFSSFLAAISRPFPATGAWLGGLQPRGSANH
jgi:hypothetical protein